MDFVTELKNKLTTFEIELFQGGNNKQRAKLNEVVEVCNAIITTAKDADDPQNGPQLIPVYITQNGAPVLVRIPLEYAESGV